jgi:hypothetical protein
MISAVVRLRQEDGKFETSLGYLARPYLKENKQTKPQAVVTIIKINIF